jgi:hypothetical protein
MYVRKLRDVADINDRTVAPLDRVRDLHRNRIMHPGETLTIDQLLGSFGLAHDAASRASAARRPEYAARLTKK